MTIPPLDTLPAAPRPPRTRRRDMPSAGAALVWLPSALLVLVLVAGTTVRVVTGGDISTTDAVLPPAAIPYLVVGGVLITCLPRNLVGFQVAIGIAVGVRQHVRQGGRTCVDQARRQGRTRCRPASWPTWPPTRDHVLIGSSVRRSSVAPRSSTGSAPRNQPPHPAREPAERPVPGRCAASR